MPPTPAGGLPASLLRYEVGLYAPYYNVVKSICERISGRPLPNLR